MCVIIRFPHCNVYRSWKMAWKMILLIEWEPCVCIWLTPLPTLPENLSVLILCTNQKQFPMAHNSFQHVLLLKYIKSCEWVSAGAHGSHSCCVFNAEPSGSSVQSISAAELLKQQKMLHQQRFQTRQKRSEEIQKRCVCACACVHVCVCYEEWMMERIKCVELLIWLLLLFFRVLQNTGGAMIPAGPSMNKAVLLSSKAASEACKNSSPPKPDLSTHPVPTLGRGYTDGEDILLDMSPPPCSKRISAAKVCVPTENKIRQAEWK